MAKGHRDVKMRMCVCVFSVVIYLIRNLGSCDGGGDSGLYIKSLFELCLGLHFTHDNFGLFRCNDMNIEERGNRFYNNTQLSLAWRRSGLGVDLFTF